LPVVGQKELCLEGGKEGGKEKKEGGEGGDVSVFVVPSLEGLGSR
jgi:hypothetical protein